MFDFDHPPLLVGTEVLAQAEELLAVDALGLLIVGLLVVGVFVIIIGAGLSNNPLLYHSSSDIFMNISCPAGRISVSSDI